MKKMSLAGGIVVGLALVFALSTVPAAQAMPSAGSSLTGKVVETMDSGGYTYVRVENKGQKTWVAMPQTKVKVGQTVTLQPGMEMENFESKSLKRKFDRIIFSGGIAK